MNNRPKIIELSEELTNMIAAGEVIERPSSIVKELIENSIDALASVIRVDLMNSGLDKISITDNGIGMTAEDIALAIKPHATSKIKLASDFFSIHTLGFRGEALPSIAAIAKMKITSSINGYEGYFKVFEFGKQIEEGLTSFPQGTKIEVSQVFQNTPARLKHLGSEQVELSHIVQIINKMSLAYPEISFVLTNNTKVLFSTDGFNNFDIIISEIYGNEVTKLMLPFEGSSSLYQIKGYTSSNSVFRSNKNAIIIMINHRIIRNQNLVFAIMDAYKGYLPVNKYPITILEIHADPSYVDVNVHPTKQEVRFTDEKELRLLITETIRKVLMKVELVYEVDMHHLNSRTANSLSNFDNTKLPPSLQWDDFAISEPREAKTIKKDTAISMDTSILKDETDLIEHAISQQHIKLEEEIIQPQFNLRNNFKSDFFQTMQYLGQYHKTYLLLEKEESLYLIDQHAAMERVMYEKITKSFTETTTEFYELLVPIKMDLPLYEIDLLETKKIELEKIHITYERFGKNTILIRKVPIWIPHNLEMEFIYDIFHYLLEDKHVSKQLMYDNLAKMLSCKQSIKANMAILKNEVSALLADLDACLNPYTCPHGRPTIIHFSKYEIEKMFKRVM
ncbi:MAG: DNA mismatch repair endonuclease MutL [Bacilli bacterium]